jgi:beta-glucosidase
MTVRAATALILAASLLTGCAVLSPRGGRSLRDFDAQARAILAQMTLDEKIGQMTQAEQSELADPGDIATYHLGSILCGGGSDPKDGNSMASWAAMAADAQARAATARLGIPLLYGVDAVHGHNNVLGAVIFPHNIGLGCTRNPELVESIARITAMEVRATGINWTFAPCVTIPRDSRWGRTYEGFSDDPALVAELGEAAVRGFQTDDLGDPLAVLACAKHFVGDGGTVFGSGDFERAPLDQGDTRVDEATLRRVHLAPYIKAVNAGVGSIMPSFSSWNGEKCSGNEYLLTDVLKGELGFDGFLISDYNAIDQVDPDPKTAIEKSINAGMDMAMVPKRYREFIARLKELVEEGRVPVGRIDGAVLRILRVKAAMGLLDPGHRERPDAQMQAVFGSNEHRAVARQAVRESVVLLKNDGNVLPIANAARRIHVAGKSADDLGNQCGGWTIDWQGKRGAVTPGGTTILEAIRQAVSPQTEVTFALDGTNAAGADIAIAVIGETPYAEGRGDRAELTLDAEDVATVERLKAAGAPVVVVLISGRPMDLGDVAPHASAILAAWLPGTEGGGVADILLGNDAPTGRLSFTWSAGPITFANGYRCDN